MIAQRHDVVSPAPARPALPYRKVLVVGLGNPDRGDDGIGPAVAHMLAERLPFDVTVLARGGDVLSVILDWDGYDALVCIDAAAPLTAPGRIHRLGPADALPAEPAGPSSHALGLADAIALARMLQIAPAEIVVYAVEGACFDTGAPLTPQVAAAAASVADQVAAEVGRLRGERRVAHA